MDMNPENSIGKSLKNAIKLYHRDEAAALLKKGALSQIPEEERTDVCKSLIALRDIKIADILAKDSSLFQPEILQLDFTSWNNREFIIKVLEKHRKRFQLNDEKTCEQLFEVACAADSADTVRFLLKQKKAVSRYYMLGSAPDSIFELIFQLKPSDFDKDQTVALLFETAASPKGTERLKRLKKAGFDLNTKNSSQESAADLLSQKIRLGKYSKNRMGERNRNQNRQALQFLTRPEKTEENDCKKKRPSRKVVIPCAIAGVLVIAGAAYTIGYQVMNHSSDTETEASTEEIYMDETNETAEYYDTEASDVDTSETTSDDMSAMETEYSTDTSLTVEDGDTVNIDYIGYIDDVAFDGGSTDGMGTSLTIGSGQYIDDFEEQLIGHNVGEMVAVNVTFPEDYGVEELNGKEARFDVTINGIYEE